LRGCWGADDGETVALYVGRLAPEKNLPLVFRAFDAMRQANPRSRLVLVGDGPERAAWQARYPQHVFAGMRTGADLAAHYASGDVFLFPSTTETYGNVTLEAMASGLAVVAYDYAAAAQLIHHGTNGVLARFGAEQEFVDLAAGLARDREQMLRLGAVARSVTERLDWSWIVREFEATLHEIAANGHRHEPAGLSA
jgi:glycosyltransferase involved in cell wall biosynthesis